MKVRTLLVDSSYLLQRSVYGAKDTFTLKFGHIGGVYSFFTTIRKLIKEHKINKVVLVWNGENSGRLRYYINENYKANRKSKEWFKKIQLSEEEIKREKEKEESILKQKVRIQAYAEELYLRQIEVDTIEADDLIAAYCMRHYNDEEIFLFSNDRDFIQLLDLNIKIILPNADQPLTKVNFILFYDYYYLNALTIKIICGDNSDNIKGVEGIKEKLLLKYFPELKYRHVLIKEICAKAKEINDERIKNGKKPIKALENLLKNIPLLKTNYKLLNLKEPFLNDAALEALEQLDMPLSIYDENGKNERGKCLYKMMVEEDDFISVYKGSFINYIEPFFTVIARERELYKEFIKKSNSKT